jgi:hypothetical protein
MGGEATSCTTEIEKMVGSPVGNCLSLSLSLTRSGVFLELLESDLRLERADSRSGIIDRPTSNAAL